MITDFLKVNFPLKEENLNQLPTFQTIKPRRDLEEMEWKQGILKGECTIDLLFDWFGLVYFANKNNIVSCHRADSKPVKQEVNSTVILSPLVFPEQDGTGW